MTHAQLENQPLVYPPTPPITISRPADGRPFYIARRPGGKIGGTFDRRKAIEFADQQGAREWFESLDPLDRWKLFIAAAYRLDFSGEAV